MGSSFWTVLPYSSWQQQPGTTLPKSAMNMPLAAYSAEPAAPVLSIQLCHQLRPCMPQVVPVFAGGLDFSLPVKKFFYDPIWK